MRNSRNIFGNEYNKRIKYIRKLYNNCEDELLKTIRLQSAYEGFPVTITQEEGLLLSILVEISKVKNILEIGTLFGYSTIWLARATGEDGKITTIEADKYDCKIAKDNFKKANIIDKVNLLQGSALKILPALQNNAFDMFFIDADKINYIYYLDYAEKMLKKGGLIVADNTFLSGAVCLDYLPNRIRQTTQDNMKKFNKRLSDKTKYKSIILNNSEGLSIGIKLF
ncbi:MAG: O-methyltransferase [Rickettsiales bacterium]|jgi:predicted O-methyltransferase YrrM|nr:O-methyltransferase [Rickettsiales bacterium]